MDIEEFTTEQLKDELLKVYDELAYRDELRKTDELMTFLHTAKRNQFL